MSISCVKVSKIWKILTSLNLRRGAHAVCLYKHPNIKQKEIDSKEKLPHDKNIQGFQDDFDFEERKLKKPHDKWKGDIKILIQ